MRIKKRSLRGPNPVEPKYIMSSRNRFVLFILVLQVETLSVATAADKVNFNRDIRPILSDKCFACHGLDKSARKANLRLDLRPSAIETKAVVPGSPEESILIQRIFSADDETVMPPAKSNKPLTIEQKNLLKQWIQEGAEYHPHWSFISIPKAISVPEPADPSHWIRTPIDAFVLDRLRKENLEPAVAATREKWLRRASFDLTGLPPSLGELDEFLADTSTNAHERAADRLLESSAFGERMTNEWLDVARYADTFGYQSDRDTHLWPWRDWAIRAFNSNLPYDQFITWQTAGDLLPDATIEQRLATTFNRLHRQTNEGGSIEQEFRLSYIADRVVTNGTAFLGLTFECCRCHDHKYDPITQAEFYKLAAFFANIDEHGLYSHFTETAPTPAMPLYEGDQQVVHNELLARIEAKSAELDRIRADALQRFASHPLATLEITDATTLSNALAIKPAGSDPELASEEGDRAKVSLEPKARFQFEDVKPAGENKLVPGVSGQAIEFGGDDSFACTGSGQYGRTTPFSFSLWLRPAEHKPRVAVLHQCVAAEDAAYRGYSLILDNGHVQFSLIHFWPGNAIQVVSRQAIPDGKWSQVAITYDGSSRAGGVHVFINGNSAEISIIRDKLSRDIKYRAEWGDSNSGGVEMSLGARFRDVGFRHGAIDELLIFDRELSILEIAKLSVEPIPDDSPRSRQPLVVTSATKFEHYLRRFDEPWRAAMSELQILRNEENEFITKVRQIMVMSELPEPRPMHVLKRGAYDAPGESVTANTPASILPLPPEFPRNRLGFAKWMTDDRHPLTSRVAVNRIWSLFFGRGLVVTVEDFGGQGQPPSHPELLDWLARDFMDHGWNVKGLCRQIVLCAAYRQSTIPHDLKSDVNDPDNRLLTRGPRYRLAAEQLRDNALAVSGLLVSKIGGPSVMPYQPAGLWEEAGTGKIYQQSKGEGLYRRSLYTYWRRTSPPPSMLTFDATGREVCTARRERTATPLQALVLLNDPQYVEAARVLAGKLLKQADPDVDQQIRIAFRLLTSRVPAAKEAELLVRLFRDQKAHFDSVPDDALALLAIGESPRDEQLNTADHAAMTVVVKAILNFDECVMKR
jgi:hypothetical protein